MSNGLSSRLRLALTGAFLACAFAAPIAASASSAERRAPSTSVVAERLPTPGVRTVVHASKLRAAAGKRFSAPRPARAPNDRAEDGRSIDAELSAAAPASANPPADPPADPLASSRSATRRVVIGDLTSDHAFTRSMIFTGAGALLVAVIGLVLVGARRRLW